MQATTSAEDPKAGVLNDLRREAEQLTKYHRELNENNPNKLLSADMIEQVTKMETERTQLLEWGENLYKEVQKLELEKQRLEDQIDTEQKETSELKLSNEKLTQKCVQLEAVLKGNTNLGTSSLKLETISNMESGELRNKLSEYAKEIDSLRRQNAQAYQDLRDAQQNSNQRVMERDSYFLTVEELENNFQKLQDKYTVMEAELSTAQENRKHLEDRLHEAQLELDVMCASLKLTRREAETHVMHMEGMDRSTKHKQELFTHLTEMVEPLRTCFIKMQQAYAQQTKEYGAFVEEVSNRQKEAAVSLDIAKDEITILETVTEHLRTELLKMKEDYAKTHSDLTAQLEAEKDGRSNQQKELDLVRQEWEKEREETEKVISEKRNQLQSMKNSINHLQDRHQNKPKNAKDTNFAKYVKQAMKGILLEKIAEKESKRTLTVFVDANNNTLMYKRSGITGGTMTVNLAEVIHFEWGFSSRAYVVASKKLFKLPAKGEKPGLKPWLCFSMYTKNRSFDFVVPDSSKAEEDLQCILLALSALCKVASGTMQTRGQFLIKKAMMKMDDQCKWRGLTRAALVYKALEKTAAEQGDPLPPKPERPVAAPAAAAGSSGGGKK
ncbi:unnamed protein product [Amoebophrya sp. A120]|nr:unnamed protein product [Amoebophrya sp. A120]|eukprot:GSA120T00020401001.1